MIMKKWLIAVVLNGVRREISGDKRQETGVRKEKMGI